MGKGKKRDNKHHNTSNQESSRGRQVSVKKAANPPAPQASSQDGPRTTTPKIPTHDSSGKFSKRKIISNWDRYSEDDVSSKVTEEKLVQRLSQLLEQSVLQASQSNFQPSLDALRHISTDDEEDIFSHAFDIDYDYLADSISAFPIQERLDLNPLYCTNTGSSTEGNSDVTLEVYPLTSEAHSSDGASNRSEHISSAASLLVAEKKQKETVNAMPPPVRNTSNVAEDEDQLFTQLLVAKTKNSFMQDESFKMSTGIDQSKTTVPDITDEENDNLLEELLAQPI